MVEKKRVAEIVFLDPPYEAAEEYDFALHFLCRNQAEMLAEGAVIVAEHGKKQPLAEQFKAKNGSALERYRLHLQGDAALSFYRAAISK